MLNRQNRLKKKEIERIETKRSDKNSDLFSIKENSTRKGLVVIISKKHIKRSTDRHLLKRRICYAYRQFLEKENKTFFIYTKKPLEKIPNFKIIKQNLCGTH